MRLPWRRAVGRPKSSSLGLADPNHPARKWIDAAAVVADRRIDVDWIEGRPAIRTDGSALRDLVGAIDLALMESADDPDLLTARAAAHILLGETEAAGRDLDRALREDRNHAEASAMQRHPGEWNHLLFLPPWNPRTRKVHPVLAERANQGDVLHCVRHDLQAALVVLLPTTGSDPEPPGRHRWEAVCAETPFGPIGAHYVLLDFNGRIHRQEAILAPSTQSGGPADPPTALLGRLAGVRTCFIVRAEASGAVVHNLRYDLPPEQRSVLATLARRLSEAAGADPARIRMAAEWHMRNFDLDEVVFPRS